MGAGGDGRWSEGSVRNGPEETIDTRIQAEEAGSGMGRGVGWMT
jgi:hypothetical protein